MKPTFAQRMASSLTKKILNAAGSAYFFLWLILGCVLNLVALAFAIPKRDPLVICTFVGNLVLLGIDVIWMTNGARILAKKNSDANFENADPRTAAAVEFFKKWCQDPATEIERRSQVENRFLSGLYTAYTSDMRKRFLFVRISYAGTFAWIRWCTSDGQKIVETKLDIETYNTLVAEFENFNA